MSQTFTDLFNQIVNDEELHLSNLYIFSKMDKEDLKLFQDTWPTIAPERRRVVIRNLVEICEVNFEVDFTPVFLLGLGDEDAQVRADAINGLWENESPALIQPLLHLLHADETALVRSTAASALGRFLYMSEVEELDPALAEPVKRALLDTIYQSGEDVEVRRRAVESIAFLCEPGIKEIIEAAYYDEHEKMRVSAIFAMGRNADKHWQERVIKELDSDSVEICFEAARACGELEATAAVIRLIALIDDPATDPEVQQMSIWSLGHIGGQKAQKALERYTESDDEVLALAAEESLEELNLFSSSLDMFNFDDDDLDEDDYLDDLDDADNDEDLDYFSQYLN